MNFSQFPNLIKIIFTIYNNNILNKLKNKNDKNRYATGMA